MMTILWPHFDQLEWRDERWLLLLYGLPLLVIIYFLRRRAAVVFVAHMPLWERVLKKERQQSSLWKELLCLLLLLLVFAAAIIALAGPYERRSLPGEGHTVLLMDQSLGTALRLEAGMSLWDLSVAELLREAEVAVSAGTVSAAGWADAIEPLTPRTRDVDDVRAALSSLRRPSGVRQASALVDLAGTLPADTRIIVITAFEPPAELRLAVPSVVWRSPLSEGEPALSLRGGIRGVDVLPDRSVSVLLEGSLATRRLAVTAGDQILLERPLTEDEIQGGRVVFAPGLLPSGRVRVRLDPPDSFPEDDVLPLVVPRPRTATVLLASDDPTPFLDAWLASSEQVDPALSGRISPTRLRVAQESRAYDVTILVGAELSLPLIPGNYILMGSSVPSGSMERKGAPREVRYAQHEEENDLLKGLDLSSWTASVGQRTELPPKGQALVMGTDGPLLARYENQGIRLFEFAHRPDGGLTSLPLLPAFPLLLDRILASLRPPSATGDRPVLRAGSAVSLKGLTEASWIDDRGGRVSLLPLGEPDRYQLPEEVGHFEWHSDGEEMGELAVAILDHPGRPGPPLTPSAPPQAWTPGEDSLDHWPLLLLLIAALLPAERILRVILLKP